MERSRLATGIGPILSGLLAAALVALTLLVAVTLSLQEQTLIAGRAPTATQTSTAPLLPTAAPSATPSPRPTQPASSPQPITSDTPTPTPTSPTRAVVCANTPASWRPYIVQSGESFATIARRFGVTESRLRQANCLSATAQPETGMRIYAPHVTCPPKPPTWMDYTIRPGDTLSSIAARFGTTVQELKRVNCLTSDKIYAGSTLWVPYRPPTSTPRPRPTRTPLPTATGTLTTTVTATPTPTATGSPTATDTPSVTPTTGTSTPETPTPTNTPTPTAPPTTPAVTDTPPPTDTPVPPTDTPTDIPQPTNTPLPPTHTPTDIPKPTNTPVPPTDTPTPEPIP